MIIAAALVVATLTQPITFVDGDRLKEMCSNERGFASAYITGVQDALEEDGLLCVPERIEASQLRDKVCQYLRSKPEARGISGPMATTAALATIYPCRHK